MSWSICRFYKSVYLAPTLVQVMEGGKVSRFEVGDKVLISGPITTKHCNRQATVIEVHPSRHAPPGTTSLDKYRVRFDDGEEIQFYDIQLTKVESPRAPLGRAGD